MVIGKFELLMDPGEDKAAVLLPNEFKLLLRLADFGRNGKRNVAIIWMSFGSALRASEIANLKTEDCINSDGTVKDEFLLPAAYTKNGESRLAYMVENVHREALITYLEYRVEKKLRLSNNGEYHGLDPRSPLFLARGPSGFQFRTKEYIKADGTIAEYKVCSSMQQLISDLVGKTVKGGSSHSGRRTFATQLADRGVELKYIKYLLGHKQKQKSLANIELNPKRLRNILKNVYGTL